MEAAKARADTSAVARPDHTTVSRNTALTGFEACCAAARFMVARGTLEAKCKHNSAPNQLRVPRVMGRR